MSLITSTSQIPYQNLQSAYQKFAHLSAADSQFRESQKGLFTAISTFLPAIGLKPTPALERGIFYWEASDIDQGNPQISHTGSIVRLEPLAKKYCSVFQDVLFSLNDAPEALEPLKQSLQSLNEAHIAFTAQFVKEIQNFDLDTPSTIWLNHPKTLTMLFDILFSDFEMLKSQMEERDEKLLTLVLPNLMIEKLLATPSYFDNLNKNELFYTASSFIKESRPGWENLSLTEKKQLHMKLLGREVSLEPQTKKLYQWIRGVSTNMHSDIPFRQNAMRVLQEGFKEMDKAWVLENTAQTKRQAAIQIIRSYVTNPFLSEKDLPQVFLRDKYILPLRKIKETNVMDHLQEIEELGLLLTKEAKAAALLKFLTKKS